MSARDIFFILAALLVIAFSIFALVVYVFCVVVVWKAGHPFMAGCLAFFMIFQAIDRLRELGE